MDIKRQGQLVEVLGSEMSNKYSVNTTDSSANTKTHSFGGRFLIPEPVVKFFHDGRELEISPNKDEDPYAAIARYVFELNDEIEKLKSELAKAQAVPKGFVLVPKEPTKDYKDVISQYLDELWMGEWGCDWDGFICVNGIDPNHVWKIVTNTKAMIEAQEPTND